MNRNYWAMGLVIAVALVLFSIGFNAVVNDDYARTQLTAPAGLTK